MFLSRFFLAIVVFQSILFAEDANPPSYSDIQNEANVPLLSPNIKERKTVKLRLANGLEVYLVSDPNAEQSAAALRVDVGSWDEPSDHPGLAHFLEHMLFLGTKSFPDEGEYSRYIAENGGIANAFTTNDGTAYLFSVDTNALPGALKRFASFFYEPLFNLSGVQRELNAIDQEYAKNLDNDSFRLFFVMKALARPEHPDHHFTMGNSLSLRNTTPDDLKKWFNEQYSANLMHLAVYSPLPLEKLRDLVVSAFQPIPNKERTRSQFDMPIMQDNASSSIVYIEPIQNVRTLAMRWELPPRLSQMKETHPEKIAAFILGHEGRTSLLAELKKENLATAIAVGNYPHSDRQQDFMIEIELTEEGLKKYPIVVERVFQTIAMVAQQGIPSGLFYEIQKQEEIEYQYQERRVAYKEAMYHAHAMSNEDLKTYPEKTELIQKFEPKDVSAFFRYLTPQNAQIFIIAPYRETRIKPQEKEPWMGVEYSLKPVQRKDFTRWIEAKPHADITLPPPNPYMPSSMSLEKPSKKQQQNLNSIPPNRGVPIPVAILNNDSGLVYAAKDTYYQSPKASYILTIRSPSMHPGSSKTIAMGDLYVKCLQDDLQDAIYNARLAGIKTTIRSDEFGIRLQISGFSDKIPLYIETIANALKKPYCDETRFIRYKDLLLRSYADKALESPLEQGIEEIKNILFNDFATSREKENTVKKISYEEFLSFMDTLFHDNYLQGVIYGNTTTEKSKQAIRTFQEALGGNPYPASQHWQKKILLLSEGRGPYIWEETIQAQGNAALLAIEAGESTPTTRAAQQILVQAIREAFFNDLRTRQQTGYLVSASGEDMAGQLVDFFAVQSNTHDGRDLLARFELFFETYLRELTTKEIPAERFDILRKTTKSIMEQPPRDVESMAELMYELAFNLKVPFNYPTQRIEALSKLTYQEFVEYVYASLGRANKRRLAVLLRGVLPESSLFNYNKARTRKVIRDEGTFQEIVNKRTDASLDNKN